MERRRQCLRALKSVQQSERRRTACATTSPRVTAARAIEGVHEHVGDVVDAMHSTRSVKTVVAHHVAQCEARQFCPHVRIERSVHRQAHLAIPLADTLCFGLSACPRRVWIHEPATESFARLIERSWPVLEALAPFMKG
eukprot:337641-Pleurochrysis_carterae.AAC.2